MEQKPSYRVVGIALAVFAIIAFSLRPILIKLSYSYVVDPVTLLALRMVFSLPFFLLAALWSRRDGAREPISRRDWFTIAGLGFFGYYLASFFDFLALQYISAGLGRLLLFTYPTMVVLLSLFFLGKRIKGREIVALLLTYAGLALVLSRAMSGQNTHLPLGAALAFGSAALYAIYLVAGSQVIQRVGSLRFSAYATIVASVCCIVQFFALRPLSALHLPSQVYGLAIIMALVSTVFPVFMTAEALRRIGANHVAMIGALGPVSTIAMGYFGLEETLTALQIFGALLVLAGVMVVSLKGEA